MFVLHHYLQAKIKTSYGVQCVDPDPKEFLVSLIDALLGSSWLPSAGGNFKNRLVKEDKMFTDAKTKINGKKSLEIN